MINNKRTRAISQMIIIVLRNNILVKMGKNKDTFQKRSNIKSHQWKEFRIHSKESKNQYLITNIIAVKLTKRIKL